jgi:hypothetical protein
MTSSVRERPSLLLLPASLRDRHLWRQQIEALGRAGSTSGWGI